MCRTELPTLECSYAFQLNGGMPPDCLDTIDRFQEGRQVMNMTEMMAHGRSSDGRCRSIMHERHCPVRRCKFLDLRVLGEFKSILDVDTQIPDGVLDLGMTE